MASFDFRFVIDEDQAKRSILEALASAMSDACSRAKSQIRSRLDQAIDLAIRASPETQSLLSGSLRGELGVVNPERAIHAITKTIQSSTLLELRPFYVSGQALGGSFKFGILKEDLSELLALDEASFTSEHGFDIAWLRWLLTQGTEPVVQEYFYVPGHFARSRTRQGVMKSQANSDWSVPEQFSGTPGDNWLTRAVFGIVPALKSILSDEIQRNAK